MGIMETPQLHKTWSGATLLLQKHLYLQPKSPKSLLLFTLPSHTTEELDFLLRDFPPCQLLLAHPHSLLLTRLPLRFLVDHRLFSL